MSREVLQPPFENSGIRFFDMEVIWKAVPGYEGLYEISNCGRLKCFVKGVITYGAISAKGYRVTCLYKNKKKKSVFIHRLVAKAFIPNPQNLPFINHKDENKLNNNVENLEWCTAKYNSNYGTCAERIKKAQSYIVCQFDLEGNLLNEYVGAQDAATATGLDRVTITNCCSGKRLSCGHFLWLYKQDKDKISAIVNRCKSSINFKTVYAYTTDLHLIGKYYSQSEASRQLKIPRKTLLKNIDKGVIKKYNLICKSELISRL